MKIRTEEVQLTGEDGRPMGLYIASPLSDDRNPAILVFGEIFGLNSNVKDITNRFAAEGYLVAAPDFYYRLGKRETDDLHEAYAMRDTLYETKIVADISRTIAYISGRPDARRERIGVVGYCFGGRVAWLAACQCPGVAASSIYYAGGIAGGQRSERSPVEPLSLAHNIKIPIQCLWGKQDQLIPLGARDKIEAALKAHGISYEWHVYEGAGHGFFRDDRPSYHPPSATDAWHRTLRFFARHLQSGSETHAGVVDDRYSD